MQKPYYVYYYSSFQYNSQLEKNYCAILKNINKYYLKYLTKSGYNQSYSLTSEPKSSFNSIISSIKSFSKIQDVF